MLFIIAMKSLEEVFKNYGETTSFRLEIESLIKPLADKFSPINLQLDEIRKALLSCEYKTSEIEAFLRRVSFFNQDFEVLWQQVQELESYKEILDDRRQDDIRKINYAIEEVNAELKNRSDDFRIGMNHIDVISKQLKGSIQTTLTHRQAVNEKVSGLEAELGGVKEHSYTSIDAIWAELRKLCAAMEKSVMQHVQAEASVDVMKQQVKGMLGVLSSLG